MLTAIVLSLDMYYVISHLNELVGMIHVVKIIVTQYFSCERSNVEYANMKANVKF
jgi:hypothetical protein